uniref:Transposase n=1 Tax=Ascaris lumbricoides TaxID=6252 RepID=A0A0M3HN14_ASCLU
MAAFAESESLVADQLFYSHRRVCRRVFLTVPWTLKHKYRQPANVYVASDALDLSKPVSEAAIAFITLRPVLVWKIAVATPSVSATPDPLTIDRAVAEISGQG